MAGWRFWLAMVGVLAVLLLTTPVALNADIFSLLPKDSSTVTALQRYQQNFGASEAVILAIEDENPDTLDAAMPELAKSLQRARLSRAPVWQNPLQDSPEAYAEILALIWLSQPPEAVNKLAERLRPAAVNTQLNNTLEQLASSFNAADVARLANDPLGLTQVASQFQNSAYNPFASVDGRLRVMYLDYPHTEGDFWGYKSWLDGINSEIARLRDAGELPASTTISTTGNPVYIVEFGSQLVRDLSLAAVGTLIIILGLFWLAYRRVQPLLWLALTLGLSLAVTLLLGAALLGEIHAVSLGFAALLMGLAVDYGLLVYQHFQTESRFSASELRRKLQPSIFWAAFTTACAFFLLTRSNLPGLAQLGLLVALGILIAATTVLYGFLPAVVRTPARPVPAPVTPTLPTKIAIATSATLLLGSLLTTFMRPPTLETQVDKLQFANNAAQATHDHIQQRLAAAASEQWLIFAAPDAQQIAHALDRTQRQLDDAFPAINANLPTALWPNPAHQKANRQSLADLAKRLTEFQLAAVDAGFNADSLLLTAEVMHRWQSYADAAAPTASHPLWPAHPANQWLFSQFASHTDENWFAMAQLSSATALDKATQSSLVKQLQQVPGVAVAGWALLADELTATMIQDALNVLLPMLVVLLCLLALAFRHWLDVVLSLFCFLLGGLILSACMALLGWSWNIMNLTALPLLLGAGVDYSIHIQLALKRERGNLSRVFQSVGRAILLCAGSTAVAFASLGLGTNAGIASLGKVTALGIVILAACAVFLLPAWWITLHRVNGRSQ